MAWHMTWNQSARSAEARFSQVAGDLLAQAAIIATENPAQTELADAEKQKPLITWTSNTTATPTVFFRTESELVRPTSRP